jgi:hypothetical protein
MGGLWVRNLLGASTNLLGFCQSEQDYSRVLHRLANPEFHSANADNAGGLLVEEFIEGVEVGSPLLLASK